MNSKTQELKSENNQMEVESEIKNTRGSLYKREFFI